MQIQNAIITGSFSYNGADLSNVTSSNAYSASLSSRTTNLESTSSVLVGASASFSSILTSVSSSQQEISSSLLQVSASYTALSGSYNVFSGSASTRITVDSASLLQVSSSQQQISSSYIALSGSYNTFSGSASTRITVDSASLLQVSASYIALSGSYNTFSGSASTRTTQIENVYATTGSNSFRADQSITGSLVVSSTITAQTLVVQTVTSSIVYSSGSNIFGSQLGDRQTFTGSLNVTGSSHNIFGNVGIGATTFTAGNGTNLEVANSSVARVLVTQTGTRSFSLSAESNAFYLYDQTANATRLYVSASGNVGIGTTSPTGTYGKLTVAGGIQITDDNNAKLEIGRYSSGAPNSYIKIGTNSNSLRITNAADSVDLFTISGSGKVGIGTTTPTSGSLQIYNNGTNHIALNGGTDPNTYLGSFSGGTYFANNYFYSGGHVSDNAAKRSMEFFMGQDEIDINTMPAGSPGTRTRVMTISGSQGYVGIGTTSPTHNLEIANTGGSVYQKMNADFGIGYFGMETADDSMRFVTAQSTPIQFYTNNTERMRITNCGGVVIGSTLAAPTGAENGWWLKVSNDTRAYFSSTTEALAINRYGSSGIMLAFDYAGSGKGNISTNGSSVSYNTTSDYRLKEDLKEVSGLDKVSAIKVYDFKWKNSDNRMDGILAHELQQVLPYAVIGEKDAEQMQGVDYSKLVPILVKGMQEQQCTICSQASMINTLKTCLGIA